MLFTTEMKLACQWNALQVAEINLFLWVFNRMLLSDVPFKKDLKVREKFGKRACKKQTAFKFSRLNSAAIKNDCNFVCISIRKLSLKLNQS